MNSQLIGVLAASVLDGADAKSLQTGAWVAGTATQYNFLNHQDVKDLETALGGCKEKRNCDAVREEFRLRDEANSARLAACTTDCAAIRSELDAGSPALKRLWESDTTGITDEFLRNNINEWSSAGPRVANQVAEAAWRGDSTSLQQLGQFLDQQGFNPFGINASGLIGLGGGAKTGTNGAADSTTSPGRASGGETVGKVEIHPPEQANAKGTDTGKAPYTSIVSTDAEAGMPYSHPVKEAGAKATGGAVELTFDKATRTWTTPAGLDYGQGSVQGNRVLHVLEHAEPNPAKTTHSVFSMDRKEILGAVDEAWLKKGSPVSGDPGAYVVPMGRAIGT